MLIKRSTVEYAYQLVYCRICLSISLL